MKFILIQASNSLNTNQNNNSSNTFLSHTVININHDDELTDDEHYSDSVNENPLFDDDNKSLILHVLSNLKLGMDLTKV